MASVRACTGSMARILAEDQACLMSMNSGSLRVHDHATLLMLFSARL